MIPLSIYKLRFKVDNSRLGYQDNNAGYRVPDFRILHIVIQHSEIRAHVCFWNYSCIIHLPVLPRPDDQTPPPLPSPLLKLSLPLFHPPQILTHISPKPNLAPRRRPSSQESNQRPSNENPSLLEKDFRFTHKPRSHPAVGSSFGIDSAFHTSCAPSGASPTGNCSVLTIIALHCVGSSTIIMISQSIVDRIT